MINDLKKLIIIFFSIIAIISIILIIIAIFGSKDFSRKIIPVDNRKVNKLKIELENQKEKHDNEEKNLKKKIDKLEKMNNVDDSEITLLVVELNNQQSRNQREREFLLNRINELTFERDITKAAYLREINS